MRGGVRPHNTRHAVLPTSLMRHSTSPTEAGQIGNNGFNMSVAQWALHARGRNWVEGRIANCPRLQQEPSVLLVPELSDIVSCSSPSDE
jgi:hypothetical protein